MGFLKVEEQTALLQFIGPVEAVWKAEAEEAGLRLLRYIPDFGYVVRGKGGAFRQAARLPFVRWIGPYLPDYRISPSLASSGAVEGVVSVEGLGSPANVLAEARRIGLETEAAGVRLVRVKGDAALVRSLAEREDVEWIGTPLSPQPMNDRSRALTGVNGVWNLLGLHGEGQLIGIADTGLDTGDLNTLKTDFQGRVQRGFARVEGKDWSDEFGHGTHIAGIILGQGTAVTDPLDVNSFAGVAPRAKLVVQGLKITSQCYCGFPEDLNELFDQSYRAGARVHNDSWGDDGSAYGSYSLHARQVDQFIWNHPDMNLVFAAGNGGSDSPTWGATPYETSKLRREPGDGVVKPGSLYAPGTAKNAITVGASEGFRPPTEEWEGYSKSRWNLWGFRASPLSLDYTSDNPEGMAPISSRGPTTDGRIKPDIVAPGSNIISTASSKGTNRLWGPSKFPGYSYNGGTSMSAGFISGAAALVRQWYQDRQGFEPSAALVKATLLNGAKEIAPGQFGTGTQREIPVRPNGVEGWGRLDVSNALQPLDPLAVRFQDAKAGLRTGEARTWLLRVKQERQPLRLMLVWSDYPGAAEASVALVNDLDLSLTATDGTEWRGNNREDRRNNVEGIETSGLAPGMYRVTVQGYNVPQGPQPFALAAMGAVGSLLRPGDANLDGALDVADAVRALQGGIGLIVLSEDEQAAADLDPNGKVDVGDAVMILRSIIGL